MRIAFDFYGIGCGNNGGTRTCILSANTLVEMGHEVFLFSNVDCGYTWSEVKAKHIKSKFAASSFPSVDVLIATGAKTSFHTQQFPRKRLGVYWIRGIETWSNPMETLIKSYRLPLLKMTNSEWQREYVLQYTFMEDPVLIQYPGLEFDFFVPGIEEPPFPFTIGGLFHPGPHKGFKDFMDIVQYFPDARLNILSSSNLTIDGVMKNLNVYQNPTEEDKRMMYQNCSVWLATTKLDGLHLPPMEAGLCGTPLVCSARPQSGMGDHAIHRETALTYISVDEAVSFLILLKENPEYGKELNERHRKLLAEKMGTRKHQMTKMVKLFEEYLET